MTVFATQRKRELLAKGAAAQSVDKRSDSGEVAVSGIDHCRGDALFEPFQLVFETLNLLLDTFELLQPSMSVAHDGDSLDQCLTILYKCVHPAEGKFELFRNVEDNFCAIHRSLLPGYETPRGQMADPAEDIKSAHIGFDLGCSQTFQISSVSVFETRLCFQPMNVGARGIGDCHPHGRSLTRKPRGQELASIRGSPHFRLVCESRMVVRLKMVQAY